MVSVVKAWTVTYSDVTKQFTLSVSGNAAQSIARDVIEVVAVKWDAELLKINGTLLSFKRETAIGAASRSTLITAILALPGDGVCVLARKTGANLVSVTETPLVWDTVITDTGGDYNASTGIFTAPTTATYDILIHYHTSGGSNTMDLVKNGSTILMTRDTGGSGSGHQYDDFNLVAQLAAGDTIQIDLSASTSTWYTATLGDNYFQVAKTS